VLVLSTVVTCRFAGQLRGAIEAAGGDRADYRVVGLCHEVRNETFSWVRPEHLDGLDHLVFVARYTMDSYGPEYAPSTPRTVILNWLSPAEKTTVDATPLSPGPVVLMVGVVAPHKGQLHVAKAFAAIADKYPDHELHIVGHVYDQAYAERVKAASDRVRLFGSLNRWAVLSAMRSCSVFVHGSPMESCSLSVLEAMYSQCAVVAARVGGIPEQIQDGQNGLLYQHGDELACAQAMIGLLDDAELRRALGVAARKTVEAAFSEREKTEQYRAVFASAFDRPPYS
jgi:glycosyltransferase involved in cell wall biosynthesis